jgi:uncharacterized protein (UPF0303 family)
LILLVGHTFFIFILVGHTVNNQWFLERFENVNIKYYIKHSSPHWLLTVWPTNIKIKKVWPTNKNKDKKNYGLLSITLMFEI